LCSTAQAQFIYSKGSTWSLLNFDNKNFSQGTELFDAVQSNPQEEFKFMASSPSLGNDYTQFPNLDEKPPVNPVGTAVPEPSTYGIFGALLLAALIVARRRHL